MQKFQLLFNKKIYSTKAGVIAAQKAWYAKVGYSLLLSDLLNGVQNPLRVLGERANGPFQPAIREVVENDIAEIKEAFMTGLIEAMSEFNAAQWATKPEIGANVARKQAIEMLATCPVYFDRAEANAFIERAKTQGAEAAKARYHARLERNRALAPAAPKPKKAIKTRIRRDRSGDKKATPTKGGKKK